MPAYKHFDITEVGDVTVVRFRNPRIAEDIDDLGNELYGLVENDRRQKLLLNLSLVEFLTAAAFGKLFALARKVNAQGGTLKLSNTVPDVYKVFTILKFDRFFDIKEDEADALAAF
jgi:anti-anti-sigma factor